MVIYSIFAPKQLANRDYIFSTIKSNFKKFGFVKRKWIFSYPFHSYRQIDHFAESFDMLHDSIVAHWQVMVGRLILTHKIFKIANEFVFKFEKKNIVLFVFLLQK